ncbi:MAG: lipase family protein [Betaproteobacteria bacterium]|nr:lipase family protein [Betaproteobacteria bacterium]
MSSTPITFVPATAKYHPENALALGRLARLAYDTPQEIQRQCRAWGLPRCRFIEHQETQAFVAGNDNLVAVAFRGTEPGRLKDWMTDAGTDFVEGSFGQVHGGFHRALQGVRAAVREAIDEFQGGAGRSLWFTGHSLGAALATLAVAQLRQEDKPVYGLYTFGQPRTGDREFERTFNQDFKPRCFRFVNNNDLVTRVPPRASGFSHVGTFLYFDRDGKLQDDPGFWYRFLDGMKARIEDLGELGPDALRDHRMDGYVTLLEKNRANNPFA